MYKDYYSYQDLADMLNQNVRTIKRKISKMNIKKRRFGGKGTPFFLGLDIHSFMLFNQPFDRLNANDKQQVKELIVNAEIPNL
tara:strand:+ start:92 stop:340 length:249 start_codon:yes stop_codon:yes gene_type:complete